MDIQKLKHNRLITLYFLTILSILAALIFGYTSFRNTLEPQYWVSANQYLSTIASENETALSFWDNGWWIKDQTHCQTYVNNGTHDPQRDNEVAYVYCATCDSCAHRAIASSVHYVIFSTREDHVYSTIKHSADYQGDKKSTLWYRALQPDFSSNYFSVIYRTKHIVILKVKVS
jgi:hypothetical protein